MPDLGKATYIVDLDGRPYKRGMEELKVETAKDTREINRELKKTDNGFGGIAKSMRALKTDMGKGFGDMKRSSGGFFSDMNKGFSSMKSRFSEFRTGVGEMARNWTGAHKSMRGETEKTAAHMKAQARSMLGDLRKMEMELTSGLAKESSVRSDIRKREYANAKKDYHSFINDIAKLSRAAPGGGGGAGGVGGLASSAASAGGSAGGGMGGLWGAAAAGAPGILGLAGGASAIVGSAGAGALGAGALGVGTIAPLLAGLGSIVAVAKPALAGVKQVDQAYKHYTQTVALHGATSKQAAAAQLKLNEAQKQAGPGSLDLVKNWMALGKAWQSAGKTAATDLFGVMNQIMRFAKEMMPTIAKMADISLKGLASGLKPVFEVMARPAFKNLLTSLASTFAKMAPALIGAGFQALTLFLRIAVAASPYVIRMFQGIEKFFLGLNEGWGGMTKMRSDIGYLVGQFNSWWNLTKALGRLLIDFFGAGARGGKGLVDSLTGILNKWDAWMNTKDGQKSIAKFFSDSIAFTKEFFKVLGPLVGALLMFIRAVMPAFTSAFKAMEPLVKLIAQILALMGALSSKLPGILGIIPALMIGAGVITSWKLLKNAIFGVSAESAAAGGRVGGLFGSSTLGRMERFRATIGGIAKGLGAMSAVMAVSGAVNLPPGVDSTFTNRGANALSSASFGLIPGPNTVSQQAKRLEQTFMKGGSRTQYGGALAGTNLGGFINSMRDQSKLNIPKGGAQALINRGDVKGVTDLVAAMTKLGNVSPKVRAELRQFGANAINQTLGVHKLNSAIGQLRNDASGNIHQLLTSFKANFAQINTLFTVGTGAWQKITLQNMKAMELNIIDTMGHSKTKFVQGLNAMKAATASVLPAIKNMAKTNFGQAATFAGQGMHQMEVFIQTSMSRGIISTQKGLQILTSLWVTQAKALGVPAKDISDATSKAQFDAKHGINKAPLAAVPQMSDTGGPHALGGFIHAAKGFLGRPGAKGKDNIPIMAGEGEAVVNHPQQRFINSALQFAAQHGASPFRNLFQLFDGVKQAHYMARGGIVTASEFGGPGDPGTGSVGYRGDNLYKHPDSFAELNMGTALGGLSYGSPISLGYHGKKMTLYKRDIGAGGAGIGGHPRAIDIWFQAAQQLGFHGLGLVDWALGAGANVGLGTGSGTVPTIATPKWSGPGGMPGVVGKTILSKATSMANKRLQALAPTTTVGGGGGGLFSGATAPPGTSIFDGMPVANWIIPELQYARAHGWTGHITSGYRSHAQNVAEGRTYHSQHEETKYPGGAVDFGGPNDSAGKMEFLRHIAGYTGPHLQEFAAGWDHGHMSGTGGALGGFVSSLFRRAAGGKKPKGKHGKLPHVGMGTEGLGTPGHPMGKLRRKIHGDHRKYPKPLTKLQKLLLPFKIGAKSVDDIIKPADTKIGALDNQWSLLGRLAGMTNPDGTPHSIFSMGDIGIISPTFGPTGLSFGAGSEILDGEIANRQSEIWANLSKKNALMEALGLVGQGEKERTDRRRAVNAFANQQLIRMGHIQHDLEDLSSKDLRKRYIAALSNDRHNRRVGDAQATIMHAQEMIRHENARGKKKNHKNIRYWEGVKSREQKYIRSIKLPKSGKQAAKEAIIKHNLHQALGPLKSDLSALTGSTTKIGTGGELGKIQTDLGNFASARVSYKDAISTIDQTTIPGLQMDLLDLGAKKVDTTAGPDLSEQLALQKELTTQFQNMYNVQSRQLPILNKFVGQGYLGAFAGGTPFLPVDGFASVHQGEAIIPKDLNPFGTGIPSSDATPQIHLHGDLADFTTRVETVVNGQKKDITDHVNAALAKGASSRRLLPT